MSVSQPLPTSEALVPGIPCATMSGDSLMETAAFDISVHCRIVRLCFFFFFL